MTTLQHTALQHTTLHYIAQRNATLTYTNYTTPQLQLQMQLYFTIYATLHPAFVCEVTTATIATTPENTTPEKQPPRSISGFALPSMHQLTSPIVSFL